DVAGESQEEAVRILAENDLGISRVDPQDVPGTPADEVVNTDPPAGTAAKKGDSVVLIVATGLVNLEDLLGATEEEAIAVLDDLELNYRISEEETDEFEPGTVSWQSRAAGLVPYDSTIELRIAVEPVPTTVVIPDDI